MAQLFENITKGLEALTIHCNKFIGDSNARGLKATPDIINWGFDGAKQPCGTIVMFKPHVKNR